jgi:glutaredoxin-dependent peroxiredoxin
MIIREIKDRKAKRAIAEKKIEPEIVRTLLSAASLAPSCNNNQPWRFIAIEEESALAAVKENLSRGNYWAKTAPLILLVVTKTDLDCKLSEQRDYAYFDSGIAVGNILLQATHEGLVAHPIAGFNPLEIKEAVGIPEEYTLLALVVIGYPGDESGLSEKHLKSEHQERIRKPEEQIICYDSWGFEEPADEPEK